MTLETTNSQDKRTTPPSAVSEIASEQRQRGRPFQRGVSGNPNGRPRLAYSHNMAPSRRMLERATPRVLKAIVKAAEGGDVAAARLVLSFTMARERTIHIDLPEIRTSSDALACLAAILQAASTGKISPDEASSLSGLARGYLEVSVMQQLTERIALLESRLPS